MANHKRVILCRSKAPVIRTKNKITLGQGMVNIIKRRDKISHKSSIDELLDVPEG